MGVGLPTELPEYVARGIDMMDCVLPSREARTGRLYTSQGRIVIKHAQYKQDARTSRSPHAVLHVPELLAVLTCGICFLAGEILYSRWRPSTTCAGTLTSCARCERLSKQGHSPATYTLFVRHGHARNRCRRKPQVSDFEE